MRDASIDSGHPPGPMPGVEAGTAVTEAGPDAGPDASMLACKTECCEPTDCQPSALCSSSNVCDCAEGRKKCGTGPSLTCVDGNCCAASDCQPSAICSSSHTCDCAAGEKKCGSGTAVTCVATDGCCGDPDCAAGFNCVSGSCLSWCDQQTRPSGVATSDYQCLDFEAGLPSTSAWSQTTSDQGAVAASAAAASSAPQSFKSTVAAETNGPNTSTATLSFTAVGSSPVTNVSVSLQIDPTSLAANLPAFSGYIDLVCVALSGLKKCLSYTDNGTLYPVSGPSVPNYTGVFLREIFTGGAAILFDCPLTRDLTANIWNSVVFTASPMSSVTINGESAGTCGGNLTNDTSVTTSIGLSAVANTSAGWSAYFDNVVVSVSR